MDQNDYSNNGLKVLNILFALMHPSFPLFQAIVNWPWVDPPQLRWTDRVCSRPAKYWGVVLLRLTKKRQPRSHRAAYSRPECNPEERAVK